MTNLSVALVKKRLIEAEEVKAATPEKLKLRNTKTKEIKNPTAGLDRSEKHDGITQIVADKGFNVDVDPSTGLSDDLVPQADFADTYTKVMPHGQTAAIGDGENEKSPKGVGVDGMTPNQTTNLKQVKDKIKNTEDDGDQKVFTIPQADFADEYTKQMPHGRAGGTTDEDVGGAGEPNERSYGKMDGGPTRGGGQRKAKVGGNAVGAKDKDTQNIQQVTGPGTEKAPSDAMQWGSAEYKTNAQGSNIVESGVAMYVNGKKKAAFEVANRTVLRKMAESYEKHGLEVTFSRAPVAWKTDAKFIGFLRESINARYNNAPSMAKQYRKAAMQRFGQICRESFNNLYEDRQQFVETMMAAFKTIERIAEAKYLDGLEFFDCLARITIGEQTGDVELATQATDIHMAARQVRNKLQEEYGFDVDIGHIFVDGQKFNPMKLREYKPRAK